MFIKTTAAQIRFLLKRNGAIITFFILLAMVLFNFISNVLAFQGKDVIEMYHPMKLLLLSWNQTYLTPDRTLFLIQLYPLLVVCPAGFALASERQTGEDILLAAKLGNIRYRFSKILAAFAVTMIVFTIPFLIEIILNCLAFPLTAAGDLMNLNCYQEEYFRMTESYLFTGLYQVSPYIYALVLTLFFATSRQKVRVEEVYAGNGLQKGDEIYLTSSQWRIVVELQPSALECSFVNIMKEGKEYLVFVTEKVRTDSETLPVYRLYSNSMITPVFCYEDMENVIIPVGEGPTYVPYSQVKDNEFFSADEEGLEAWNSLKQKMLAAYPK